jgi:geranylgeranyl pyrophosphate synthase
MFASEQDIGKSVLSDLQEAKKTILVWYAYRNAAGADKKTIQKILSREQISHADLIKMKKIITATGALNFAREEIASLIYKARHLIDSLSMKKKYRELLNQFAAQLLQV